MTAVVQLDDPGLELEGALTQIAGQAAELDAAPGFPAAAFEQLSRAGALSFRRRPFAEELDMLRAVAAADASVGRILDGHVNAVERLAVAGLLDDEARGALAEGRLLLGVWGADPTDGEGDPARLTERGGQRHLTGVKTFCSGAGGLHRALVVAREGTDRRLAYVDLSEGVQIDRGWYRGAGLRASESHRVEFERARVLDLVGGPDELLREPYFSRDGLRTAATWAGIADSVYAAALGLLAPAPDSELTALAVGRMSAAVATINRWLEWAALHSDDPVELPALAIEARHAIATACRSIASNAAESCGSRPLATGGALDRGRRDLDLFLLQHRLDRLLARRGSALLESVRG